MEIAISKLVELETGHSIQHWALASLSADLSAGKVTLYFDGYKDLQAKLEGKLPAKKEIIEIPVDWFLAQPTVHALIPVLIGKVIEAGALSGGASV